MIFFCRTSDRPLNLEFFQLLLSTSDRLLFWASGFWVLGSGIFCDFLSVSGRFLSSFRVGVQVEPSF